MNYTELTDNVQGYCENTETAFVAAIPTFIRQAEERIVRSVTLPELRNNATGTMTADSRYLQRPSDFLAPFSMATVTAGGVYSYMLEKDVNFIREAYPDPTTTGTPKYYAAFDGDTLTTDGFFVLGPTPDLGYTTELYYYYDPPSIVDDATSWLGNNAEKALLYGTLIEAYVYMKGDPDLMEVYKNEYTAAMDSLDTLSKRGMRDDYRDGKTKGAR